MRGRTYNAGTMLKHIIVYVVAIFAHWLVSWGAVALMLIAMLEKWWKPIPKKLFFGIAIVLLIVAMFQAWRDQYTSAEWRGSEIQQLSGVIEGQNSQIVDQENKINELKGVPPKIIYREVPASKPDPTEKRKCREIVDFMREGENIQHMIVRDPNKSLEAVHGIINQWTAKVESKLLSELGEGYVARFRSQAGLNSYIPAVTPPEPNSQEKADAWNFMNMRLTRLNQFLEQLKC